MSGVGERHPGIFQAFGDSAFSYVAPQETNYLMDRTVARTPEDPEDS